MVLRYEVTNTGTASSAEVALTSGILVPRLEILEIVTVSENTTLDLASGTWIISRLAPGASVELELRMIVREGEDEGAAASGADPGGIPAGAGAGAGANQP